MNRPNPPPERQICDGVDLQKISFPLLSDLTTKSTHHVFCSCSVEKTSSSKYHTMRENSTFCLFSFIGSQTRQVSIPCCLPTENQTSPLKKSSFVLIIYRHLVPLCRIVQVSSCLFICQSRGPVVESAPWAPRVHAAELCRVLTVSGSTEWLESLFSARRRLPPAPKATPLSTKLIIWSFVCRYLQALACAWAKAVACLPPRLRLSLAGGNLLGESIGRIFRNNTRRQ